MDRNDFRERLNWNACVECGDCLVRCRYMSFTREEAKAEMGKVNRGEPSRALDGCMSCYACNAFCEKNAHPYERIHYAWNDRYEREGLPARASYLMPSRQPNFREDMSFTDEERELHRRWAADDPPARTVLYPGCNLLALPLLVPKAVMNVLPVWGRWDLCCGEMYFRMGILSKVREIAGRLTRFYRGKKIDEMVFVCPAGYNMFTNVLPQQFEARFSFRTTSFADWFMRKVAEGAFSPKRLSGDLVIQDSCHARVLGRDFMESQRRLLAELGLTVRETPRNREDGLCCGMAAGCNSYSAFDLLRHGMRNIRSLDRAEGGEIVQYCTGCYLTSGTMRLVNPFGKRLTHLLEWVGRALGEKRPRMLYRRAFSVLKGIALHALPKYFSRKRFRL
ncbi:MAG: (Fe-S)-binding protein [Spirochaetes bacterium]|nr:(Fe-S)-binding protein [Spirochaetota bacterium]